MKKDMDTIQFESKYEIEDILFALMQWQAEHPKDKKSDTVQELALKLDIMHMEW